MHRPMSKSQSKRIQANWFALVADMVEVGAE